MGRSKTRKKNQRNGQNSEDPDVSETEPSSSDNVSNSLNETMVLSSSNNVMDTDVEDSGQTTGDSSPADENQPEPGKPDETSDPLTFVKGPKNLVADYEFNFGDIGAWGDTLDAGVAGRNADDVEDPQETSRLNQWLDDQNQPEQQEPEPVSTSCSHSKTSVNMTSLRKSMKNDTYSYCSARPCTDSGVGGENGEVSSKDLWMCLQCGSVGCGDQTAQGGDAEIHYKTPRSDQHYLVVRLGGGGFSTWCYSCASFVDGKPIQSAIQFMKRHPKIKQLQSAKPTAPAIALGPPPPPPQPEVSTTDTTQFKRSNRSMNNKQKMKYNKYLSKENSSQSTSSWDCTNREEWPLGLENLGNTCFMNSALQCLSRTRSLIPKLDLYGTGNTIEILVTAEPPSVVVQGTVHETNGDNASALFQLPTSSQGVGFENGETNGVNAGLSSCTDIENGGGSSPSSTEMDSLLDLASAGTSVKSSPTAELTPENYKDDIEKELKKCLRLKLTIPKDSMTARLRQAFKAMTRSLGEPNANSSSTGTFGPSTTSEYFAHRGRNVFTPNSIHNAMSKHFRPGQQHDSHELLRTVVDMMKKDQIKAFRLAIMQCYGLKKTDAKNCDPKVGELLKQWDRKLYHKTFVDEIFGGELVTFQTCLTCRSVRRSHEDFLDLSLPIRVFQHTKNQFPKRTYSLFDDDGDSKRSLEDCLKSFIEPEQLAGSNAVECENCHKLNLERLANGASFEEVFPGVKPPNPPVVVEPPPQEPVSNKVEGPEPEPLLETEMDAVEPLVMEEDTTQGYSNAMEDMDDLDEPAVDGILGNTSDMEDEGNDVPPLDLGIVDDGSGKDISTADFINASADIHNKENMTLSLAATQDEGFSESDSSEEKKSASISASSSRNSISEAENGGGGPNSTTQQPKKETTKPIPITKCPCSRRQMVLRPPECLTIHLKRFQITSHGTSKLSDRVNFPFILDLTPFCSREHEDLQRLDGQDVYDEDGEVKYALYGIVEHSGSLHWGHYVAYIKNRRPTTTNVSTNGDSSTVTASTVLLSNDEDEGNSSTSSSSEILTPPPPPPERWFYISDSSVSPSSLESVLGMDPYILFYERIRGQEKKERLDQLHQLNNPTFCGTSTSSTVTFDAASNTDASVSLPTTTTATFNNDPSTEIQTEGATASSSSTSNVAAAVSFSLD